MDNKTHHQSWPLIDRSFLYKKKHYNYFKDIESASSCFLLT